MNPDTATRAGPPPAPGTPAGAAPRAGRPTVSSATAVGLVARREVTTRLRSRAYLIMTGILLLGAVALGLAIKLIGGEMTSTVGFTGPSAQLVEPFRAASAAIGHQVEVSTVPDPATGERRVRDGELDALVTGTAEDPRVVVDERLDERLSQAFTVLAQRRVLDREIAAAGGDPAAVNAAVAAATVPVDSLRPAREFTAERITIGMLAGVLVYLALMVYGQLVAQGVVEEKANRIVELLLTTIRPWQLMLGKVVGIGLVGLLQVAAVVVGGLVSAWAFGVLTLPAGLLTGTGLWALVWFLLGFVVYALLFAATGALVSRQEDAAGVTAPVIILLIVPYILGVSVLPTDPGNTLAQALSLIPLFSPLLMPMRIAMGTAAGWEIALSVVLTLLLIAVLVWLAGRIYANAVLRAGTRVRLRDALRSA